MVISSNHTLQIHIPIVESKVNASSTNDVVTVFVWGEMEESFVCVKRIV